MPICKLMRERGLARSSGTRSAPLSQGMAMEASFRERCNSRSLSSRASLSAIFFDLDNTLVETRRADSQACRKVREDCVLT